MNKILHSIFLFFFMITLFTACGDDVCKNKSCDNGVCDTISGNCLCSAGYQSDADGICTVEWANKFVGTFNVWDSCIGSHAGIVNYNLAITATSPQLLSLDNLANKGFPVTAKHSNSINFSFNETVSNGLIFQGTGKMIDSSIVIKYILNDSINNNGSDTCFINIPR